MSVGEYCNREVIVATAGESLLDAARLMREQHVGDIVVVREEEGQKFPIGIVTDRDVVIEVVAGGVDPASLALGDLMGAELFTITEERPLMEAIALMRDKGVRRLPVVNAEGGLEGLLSVDDTLELVAEQLSDLARLIGREQSRERRLRSRA
jgi:CBS domain-containing protein